MTSAIEAINCVKQEGKLKSKKKRRKKTPGENTTKTEIHTHDAKNYKNRKRREQKIEIKRVKM